MADPLRVAIAEDSYFDPARVEVRGPADRIEALGGSLRVVSLPIPEGGRG